MISGCRYIILFALLLCSAILPAQDLNGTWEGMMGRRFLGMNNLQYLQVNIVQRGYEICGYTFDSVVNSKNDHCKAVFEGRYDKKRKEWVLIGTRFMENSGTHFFMRIKIWNETRAGWEKMEAEVSLKDDPNEQYSFFDDRETLTPFGIMRSPQPMRSAEYLQLKRVSHDPPQLPDSIPPCFPELNQPKDSFAVTREQVPLPTRHPDTSNIIPKKVIDSLIVLIPGKKDSILIVPKINTRKNTIVGRIPVTVKNITLNVYDNVINDGDTISIYYNGRLLVNRQRLSEKPIVINLELDENTTTHEIILYAHNLGSIPPNTALIVVTAGDKRYELHSSASLEENAVLIFEYSPK